MQIAFEHSTGDTRELILRRAGHCVVTVYGTAAALEIALAQLQGCHLVLLGRDAPLPERDAIAKYLKDMDGSCYIIALQPAYSSYVEYADINCPGSHPGEWMQAIDAALKQRDPEADG